MRILLMSDTHFGFAAGTEREQDAFLAFEEGIQAGLQEDAILLGGDIFDNPHPSTDSLGRVMASLVRPLLAPSPARVEGIGKEITNHRSGIPVVAIAGNHERRPKGLMNPVQALEAGGLLIHLHGTGVLLRKGQEKVAIQGLSSIPEHYVKDALAQWNPQPLPGAYNIFIVHQNLDGFIFSPKAVPRELLPQGFDLYLCGDIHESHRSQVHGKPLILPGSTVATQLKQDATTPRTYCLIDTASGEVSFHPFRNQRAIHYQAVPSAAAAEQALQGILAQPHPLKPIIKLVCPEDLSALEARFRDQALLAFTQEREIPALSIAQQARSAQESGRDLLGKALLEAGLDPRLFLELFELLLERQGDAVLAKLRAAPLAAPAGPP